MAQDRESPRGGLMQRTKSGARGHAVHRTKSLAHNEANLNDDEDDGDHSFWGQLWHAAGYRHTEDGDYIKVRAAHVPEKPEIDLAAIQDPDASEDGSGKGDDDATEDVRSAAAQETAAALVEALRLGESEKAMELLQVAEHKGTLRDVMHARDGKGWTVLHWAVEFDPDRMPTTHREARLALVKKLLSFHASVDLNLRTQRGNTALVHAIWNGNLKVCQMLVKHKGACDLSLANDSGWTALHWAVLGRRVGGTPVPLPEIVQLLLRKAGGAARGRTRSGDTLLHMAARQGFAAVAQLLLQSGAAVDARNLHGDTALRTAAEENHPEVLALLVAAGASPAAPDALGVTPAQVYARGVVHVLRCARFPSGRYEAADDYDRAGMDAAMAEWLAARRLPADALLAAAPDPELVLSLAAPARAALLAQPPDALADDPRAEAAARLETLALLLRAPAPPAPAEPAPLPAPVGDPQAP